MVGKNTNHYEILGVSKNASQDDLDKAFEKAAFKNDPDNGGDPEKFKEVKIAYGILSHPLEREIYDQYGEDGRRQRKGRDVIRPLMVSLEDLYNGTTLNIPCSKGKGEKDDNNELEVHIEKGMQEGQKISFSGEDLNRVSGGGVVFILLQKKHPVFKRKGDNLFVELTLSPIQAVWGFQIGLTHLDNREIIIQSSQGEIVKNDQVKVINDEGMPMYQRPFMRGKLYIHFKVDFSSQVLSAEEEEWEIV